ncbi:MAG: MBL fold metallo-hydrolase [Clostridiales bacterium]
MDIRVHSIGGYITQNYLLETALGWIAIDTGYPGGEEKFLKRLARFCRPEDLKYIFLTHAHDDHAGFLAALLEAVPAKVVLHPAAVPSLEAGENAEPAGSGYATRVGALFGLVKKSFTFPPVHLGDRAVFVQKEDDQFFEELGLPLRIVFLPGHTADSIGLFLPQTGQLFCGDAAMNALISLGRHTIWIDDVSEFQRSWDKMIALKPVRIYPSHGTPFSPKDLLKYRRFMDGRPVIQPNNQPNKR